MKIHIRRMIFNNFWLKVLSLLLAVVTWIYISEVVLREKGDQRSPLHKIISPSRYISKQLQVEPIFVGYPPSEYEFLRDEVVVDPKQVLVVGPRSIIGKIKRVRTQIIDLSEYTRTTTTEVGLAPISKTIDIDKVSVKITMPIKKIAP